MDAAARNSQRLTPISRRFAFCAIALVASMALSGCGENYPELVRKQHAQVTEWVRKLGAALDRGLIRNGNIIKQYAEIVRRDRPEMARLTTELAKEGTTKGLAYSSLTDRLSRINLNPKDERQANEGLEALLRIEAASDVDVFNDSLIDVANVLADMSNGKLPRLHVPRSEPRAKTGAGSHLVGNPRYGQWQGGGANSFWVFYGQYALMRSLFFGPRTYYHRDWYSRRGWSYYGNVGRHYYGRRADTRRWNRAAKTSRAATPRKSYGRLRSQRRLSSYGPIANRGAGSATRRASSYQRSSSYGSSARGTSRSAGFRGK